MSSKYLSLDEHGNTIPKGKLERFEEDKFPPSIHEECIVPYESVTANRPEKQAITDHKEIQAETRVSHDPNSTGTSNNKNFIEKYENWRFVTKAIVRESQKVCS